MARHPASRRVHRRSSGPDDVFVEGVLESTAWAQQHARTLIIGIAVILVVALGFLYWRSSRATMREA
ncbi:MAG: hypothetical protein ACRELX_18015, partial [Longimicrobiales bacterium]